MKSNSLVRNIMVKVVGHRGAAGLEPENTLRSFGRAMELGVAGVECDVRLTADGQVVVMHDEAVDRTTNGRGAIADMTLQQIRQLDAGKGQTVPTLDELLELLAGKCELFCELKADAAAVPAAEAIARRKMTRDVLLISFHPEHLAAVAGLGGAFRLGLLSGPCDASAVQAARQARAEALIPHHRNCLDRQVVDLAHRQGLAFAVFTPNTLEDMKRVIDLGVDAVITDRPDILLDHLKP